MGSNPTPSAKIEAAISKVRNTDVHVCAPHFAQSRCSTAALVYRFRINDGDTIFVAAVSDRRGRIERRSETAATLLLSVLPSGTAAATTPHQTCATSNAELGLAYGTSSAYDGAPMIQANCRARFTAADFDFVVRTLARSQNEHVSLVDLLADSESRDFILDSPRLVDAILSQAGHLRISSQFYFYVLARHVLRDAGITDRKLCDYVGSLLEKFSRVTFLQAPNHSGEEYSRQYISDMLIALSRATPEEAFLLRAYVGNYSLFISGIFHENTQQRSLRGAPNLAFYEQVGRRSYHLLSSHATARRCELNDVYAELADRFHDVRIALNELSDRLLHLDEDEAPSLLP